MNSKLRRELLALAGIDQDVRARVNARWQEATPVDMDDPLYREWVTVDEDSTTRLKAIIAAHGWPGYRLVGTDGADAAWLLLQHTPDLVFMREGLELLRTAVTAGDASPKHLAYLEDRVLMRLGQPQIYGTQSIARDGTITRWDTIDPAHLNQRRTDIGLNPL